MAGGTGHCQHDSFAFLFDPQQTIEAFNEVPVQYMEGDTLVYGIIDRLVISGDTAFIIDYKTHRSASPETVRHWPPLPGADASLLPAE